MFYKSRKEYLSPYCVVSLCCLFLMSCWLILCVLSWVIGYQSILLYKTAFAEVTFAACAQTSCKSMYFGVSREIHSNAIEVWTMRSGEKSYFGEICFWYTFEVLTKVLGGDGHIFAVKFPLLLNLIICVLWLTDGSTEGNTHSEQRLVCGHMLPWQFSLRPSVSGIVTMEKSWCTSQFSLPLLQCLYGLCKSRFLWSSSFLFLLLYLSFFFRLFFFFG